MILSASISSGDDSLTEIDFDELYNNYFNLLCNTVLLKTGDHSDSRDIVQELFIDIWENRDTLLVKDPLDQYLLASLETRIALYMHNKGIKERVWRDYEQFAVSMINPAEMAEERPIGHIAKEVIDTAVRQLPEKMQYVIVQHQYYNKSIRQLSLDMQITPQAVKIQVTKALHRIETFIKNHLSLGYSFLIVFLRELIIVIEEL